MEKKTFSHLILQQVHVEITLYVVKKVGIYI